MCTGLQFWSCWQGRKTMRWRLRNRALSLDWISKRCIGVRGCRQKGIGCWISSKNTKLYLIYFVVLGLWLSGQHPKDYTLSPMISIQIATCIWFKMLNLTRSIIGCCVSTLVRGKWSENGSTNNTSTQSTKNSGDLSTCIWIYQWMPLSFWMSSVVSLPKPIGNHNNCQWSTSMASSWLQTNSKVGPRWPKE